MQPTRAAEEELVEQVVEIPVVVAEEADPDRADAVVTTAVIA